MQTISKVGSTIVIGGNFTSVSGQARSCLAAFNKDTGVLLFDFHPVLNGPVLSSTPGRHRTPSTSRARSAGLATPD